MKINSYKINGFGKLKNKEVNLTNGINIIYGENEAGKSTMLKFISSMFFGASKNKNGKDISDFDKFIPWETEEYSGKIKYTLDNNNSFEIYREFRKKNPIIYNDKKEDISKNFSVDKNKGIVFFTEQTDIDEDTFYNTAITEQEGIKLSKASQLSIVQRISNIVTTGDDKISYKKSIEKISKMQNEKVGTNKTIQRPINIVENRIQNLLNEKKSLEIYKEDVYNNSMEKEQLYLDEKIEENKRDFLKEIKNKLDNNRIKNAEINFNRNLEKEFDEKIEKLNKKIIEQDEKEIDRDNRINFKLYNIILSIFIALFIIIVLAVKGTFVKYLFILPVFAILGYIKYKEKKVNRQLVDGNKIKNEAKNKILNEIEVLKQNREIQKKEAEEKIEKLRKENERDNKEIINKYINVLDLEYLEENLEKSYDEIIRKIERKENKLNTIKFRIHSMEKDTDIINNKLDDLSRVEEELQEAELEKEELISLNNSFNIAKECMECAYSQVKSNISPRFTKNLCDIISKISNNRYNNITFNDIDGLNVEISNGQYFPVSRLSIGTIDQMYLSLRLSCLNEISKETMPIILDEAFAYFDNNRLTNMMKYISLNYTNEQIIIFTCSNREMEILDNLKINYNLIKL